MRSADITTELSLLAGKHSDRWENLIPRVYVELRQLAAKQLRKECENCTLQPTELVHEAYLRLIRQRHLAWENRSHFYGVAAHLMRLILVDRARSRGALKRRGGEVANYEIATPDVPGAGVDIQALHEALGKLAELDPRQSRIVELRYFGGLTVEETADVLGVSPKTVVRDWRVAKAWLHGELSKEVRGS